MGSAKGRLKPFQKFIQSDDLEGDGHENQNHYVSRPDLGITLTNEEITKYGQQPEPKSGYRSIRR